MTEFRGVALGKGQATFMTEINGLCVSLHGDDSCVGDCYLRRFYLAVFDDPDTRRSAITAKIFPNKDEWLDDEGTEVCGSLDNFLAAVEWCKTH